MGERMSDWEVDLDEIIEKLQHRLEELRMNNPPGFNEEESTDILQGLYERISVLTDLRHRKQASRILIRDLTPRETAQISRAVAALGMPLQWDQGTESVKDNLGIIFKSIDLIKLAAEWVTYDVPHAEAPAPPQKDRLSRSLTSIGPPAYTYKKKPIAKVPLDFAEASPPKLGRVVNTGFANRNSPDDTINPRMPLRAGDKYFFWLEIGLPQENSIEETPSDIPAPAEAVLTVVLFTFQYGLKITPGADVGELTVQKDLTVCVSRQPLAESPVPSARLKQRLFFPVAAPIESGEYKMRCHIYWRQILLQSRIISVSVRRHLQLLSEEHALHSKLDYSLSHTLEPARITKFEEHRLSVFLNGNDDGTHSFHFFGTDGQLCFKQDDVRFREGELQGMISQARGTLRIASWGNDQEWREGIPYKYKKRQLDPAQLTADLTNLACWGYAFYTKVRNRLVGRSEFEKVMLKPGIIQLAMKESPSYVLPAALIYDYPLDTGAESYSLCNNFETALKNGQPLEDLECFHGNCPTREDLTTICPSGFWGFRHYLGMPLSVGEGPDAPPCILVQQDLRLSMIVATNLQLLTEHSKALKELQPHMVWNYADSRDQAFRVLKESPHLVYFYCHGGLLRGMPYLQVGTDDRIDPSNLEAYKIQWEAPRPLIFINGCHTTAVEPLQALEFISPLVTYSHGAGVIGTEITIFEELATVFAEECLGRFLQGESIGAALHGARLRLLQEGNPLGLVYIPFVIATLALKDQRASALGDLPLPKEKGGKIIDEGDSVVIGGIRLEKHHE